MAFKRLSDLFKQDITGKRVLVRVDFNVPMKDGVVTDDTRLQAALPTIAALKNNGAKVILLSHFGRPKGKVVPEMSLGQLVPALSELLAANVTFVPVLFGDEAKAAIDGVDEGSVVLLENTRFYEGEEKNDPELAKQVAALGDFYVNDAFSAAHRAHVSTEGVAKLLPSFAGESMARELDHLDKALGNPVRPVLAIVGGAKVSSKIDLLENLVTKVDALAIGGGMANTFLAAQGIDVGKSLCEKDLLDKARDIMAAADKAGCKIVLPVDVVVSKEFAVNPPTRTTTPNDTQDDEMILDAGPESVKALEAVMAQSKTIIWNGPLGAFETAPFDVATVEAAKAAAKLAKTGNVIVVAGGGDTVSAMNHAGVAADLSFISTAGGAFLEWMEGKELPGVSALQK